VLLVKEISRVPRIQRHGLEAIPRSQHRARPLPDSAHLGLPSQGVAASCHGYGVPVLETDIGVAEVDEEVLPLLPLIGRGRARRWRGRYLDAIVREMTGLVDWLAARL